jgi:hypothetical protein
MLLSVSLFWTSLVAANKLCHRWHSSVLGAFYFMALDLSPQLTAHRPRKANGKVSDLALPSSSLNVAMSQPASAPPRPAPRAWTVQDKIEYFRQLPPILCPASPPPLEHPLMTEDEALSRSRARVERMTKRLASLPLYQARHLINLASTQLKGPFSPGCKYWGMTPPVASGPTVRARHEFLPGPV